MHLPPPWLRTELALVLRRPRKPAAYVEILRSGLEEAERLQGSSVQLNGKFTQEAAQDHRRIAFQIAATGPTPNDPANVMAQTITDTGPTTSGLATADRLRSDHSSTKTMQTNTTVMKTR
jgi:hypothetical protein